eukprot:1161045-Pelagomonas_calceolata.AAC.20
MVRLRAWANASISSLTCTAIAHTHIRTEEVNQSGHWLASMVRLRAWANISVSSLACADCNTHRVRRPATAQAACPTARANTALSWRKQAARVLRGTYGRLAVRRLDWPQCCQGESKLLG